MGKFVSLRVGAIAVACLVLGGTSASAWQAKAGAAKTHVVSMQIAGFDPAILSVKSGDRVTWVNKDLFPHTATAVDKAFDSRSVAPDGTWTFIAGKPGTYLYSCTFHPTMKGTINVQ
jgi:plastocyanin